MSFLIFGGLAMIGAGLYFGGNSDNDSKAAGGITAPAVKVDKVGEKPVPAPVAAVEPTPAQVDTKSDVKGKEL